MCECVFLCVCVRGRVCVIVYVCVGAYMFMPFTRIILVAIAMF